LPVGEKVKLGIWRDKKRTEVTVELGKRPSEVTISGQTGAEAAEGTWRGIKVSNIDERIAQMYQLEAKEGVIITDISPNSPAEEAGLAPGAIITEVNKQKITNASDFAKAVKDIAKNKDVLVETSRGYLVVKGEK
jgi:serine protease Do